MGHLGLVGSFSRQYRPPASGGALAGRRKGELLKCDSAGAGKGREGKGRSYHSFIVRFILRRAIWRCSLVAENLAQELENERKAKQKQMDQQQSAQLQQEQHQQQLRQQLLPQHDSEAIAMDLEMKPPVQGKHQ